MFQGRITSARRIDGADRHAPAELVLRKGRELPLLLEERLPEARERHLLVQLGVSNRDGRLVDEDLEEISPFLVEHARLRALEGDRSELALFVLQDDREVGAHAALLEEDAEFLGRLRAVGHDLAVVLLGDRDVVAAVVDPLEEVGRPGDRGIGPVDFVDAGDRSQPKLSPLDDRDGAAVDVDEGGARVRDGLHDAVEVERRRDFAADGEQCVELLDPALGAVAPGVVQRPNRLVAEIGQEKGVGLVNRGRLPRLVDDDHEADRFFVFEQRQRQNGRDRKRAFLPEEMLGEARSRTSPPARRSRRHDRGADRVGRMDLVVLVDGRRGERDLALASLEDPERRDFGVCEVDRLPRDHRRELVPVQRRTERLRKVVKVRQPLDRVEHSGGLLVLFQARPTASAASGTNVERSRERGFEVGALLRKRTAATPMTPSSAARGRARQTPKFRAPGGSHGSSETRSSADVSEKDSRSRISRQTNPSPRGTDCWRIRPMASPVAPVQVKTGWIGSCVQTRAASAPAIAASQRAAQADVWASVSQASSSARAAAKSPSVGVGGGAFRLVRHRVVLSGFGAGSEARDRFLQVLMNLEDGVELRHFQELLQIRSRREQLGLAALPSASSSAFARGRRAPWSRRGRAPRSR